MCSHSRADVDPREPQNESLSRCDSEVVNGQCQVQKDGVMTKGVTKDESKRQDDSTLKDT